MRDGEFLSHSDEFQLVSLNLGASLLILSLLLNVHDVGVAIYQNRQAEMLVLLPVTNR